jgi:large subunit ribosomal protein L24
MKLKVGDTVTVIAGAQRGRQGKIERVLPHQQAVVVEKVGRVKKHLKPTRRYPRGGIVEVARPIPAANVMVVCPHCGRPTRVAIRITAEKKVRVCKRCGKSLDDKAAR